jgi:hypothetical protein
MMRRFSLDFADEGANVPCMRKTMLPALLLCALAAPALAASYPVSGKWGVSTGGEAGPIDCTGIRVMSFDGDQRTDSKGGVPAYRNDSVTADGPSRFRIVDTFANAQVGNAHTEYTLQKIDADHIVLQMPGGTLKLQRCQ